MIFKPELARLVVRGKKTETRRPLRPAPRSPWIVSRDGTRRRRPPRATLLLEGVEYLACRYQPGSSYSVQPGRGKPGLTHGPIDHQEQHRIVITDVRRERAGDIDYAAAVAEGFRTTAEFKAYWIRLHEPGLFAGVGQDHDHGLVDEHGTVDIIECVEPSEDLLVERFEERHADTLVWVISFALERDTPRLLTPAARDPHDGDEHGYTHDPRRALPDTAETLAPTVLDGYAADARDRWAGDPGRRDEMLKTRLRSLANRLRQVGATHMHEGGLTSGAVDQLEEHIAMLERSRSRGRRDAA